MKATRTILLDDYDTAQVVDLFGRAAAAQGRKTDWRAVLFAIVLLAVLVIAGIGYARAEAAAWTSKDGGYRLTYVDERPVLRIEAYTCQITGSAAIGQSETSRTYRVSGSSGGRCDAFLGGRIEIDKQADKSSISVFASGK
jgi:hypothetical protein